MSEPTTLVESLEQVADDALVTLVHKLLAAQAA